ncbi:MAG: lipid-A-disaccharide synthase [Limnochordales bacterium]|nr:lipid-A-disaccharide synthase [Limnochordales bacterium]
MAGLIWVSAGEASGDRHGAALVAALRALCPELRFAGLGGPAMRQCGVEIVYDPTSLSTVGFLESLRATVPLRRVLQRLTGLWENCRPDLAVLIDFPGFNLRLAEMLHQRGIPVVYYLPPTAWLWGEGRALQVARNCVQVLCTLPVELPVYEKAGAAVRLVGHPVLDYTANAPTREEARRQLNLDPDTPCFALLPGSRTQELDELLPPLVKAASLVRRELPSACFLLPAAPTLGESRIREMAERLSPGTVRVLPGPQWMYPILRAADGAAVASGTATLEAAVLGTPMVIIYRTSLSTYLIGRKLLHLHYVGMPNILAGEEIVPELLQHRVTAENIAQHLLNFFRDAQLRRRIQSALASVVRQLGTPGVAARAAQAVWEILERRRGQAESAGERKE